MLFPARRGNPRVGPRAFASCFSWLRMGGLHSIECDTLTLTLGVWLGWLVTISLELYSGNLVNVRANYLPVNWTNPWAPYRAIGSIG